MQIVKSFDPSASSNGTIQVGAADAGSKLLLYNKSPYDLQLDFLNGNLSIAHAKQARFWTLDGDTKQVGWSQLSSQNVVTPAQSLVQGELYGATEPIEGVYPVSLDISTDLSNNLVTTNQAGFIFTNVAVASGASLGQIFINHAAGKRTYILGFSVSFGKASAALDHEILLSGFQGGISPTYYLTEVTTGSALLAITFPFAIPAATLTTDIALQVTGTMNSNATAVLYGYQV